MQKERKTLSFAMFMTLQFIYLLTYHRLPVFLTIRDEIRPGT